MEYFWPVFIVIAVLLFCIAFELADPSDRD